ncbi:MAG TPA: helix-turn-helix domain-containing protein [Chlamydiales bacterium]|nr:helix-turn-helix domain-containing protein [Chlamydiales bacterium]
MSAQLKEIGQRFKAKREEMHLSLKEVENATSIRQNHLEAIEDGKIDQFFASVYVLGFLKQYATFLGFDGEKLAKENSKLFSANKQPQEFSYGIGTLDMRNKNSGKKLSNFMMIGVVGVVLILAYFFSKIIGLL